MPTGTWPEMVWLVNIDFRIDCPEGGRTRLREVAMSMEHERRRIGRRTFLWGAAASAGAVAVGGALAGIPGAIAGKPGGTATRNPLYIPRTVTPSSYTLTAGPPPRTPLYIPRPVTPSSYPLPAPPATVSLGGGKLSSVWAYNGLLPGPTLLASRGDTATITLSNRLSQPTITHWHGMIVDDLTDGAPRLAIPSLATYNYNFTINQRA